MAAYRWYIRARDYGTSSTSYGSVVSIPLADKIPKGRSINAIRITSASIPLTVYNVVSGNQTFTMTVAGNDYPITVPVGLYTGDTLLSTIDSLLTTALTNGVGDSPAVDTPSISAVFNSIDFTSTFTLVTGGGAVATDFVLSCQEGDEAPGVLRLLGWATNGQGDKNTLSYIPPVNGTNNSIILKYDRYNTVSGDLSTTGVTITYTPPGGQTIQQMVDGVKAYMDSYYNVAADAGYKFTIASGINNTITIKTPSGVSPVRAINITIAAGDYTITSLAAAINGYPLSGAGGQYFNGYSLSATVETSGQYRTLITMTGGPAKNFAMYGTTSTTTHPSILKILGFTYDGLQGQYISQAEYYSPKVYFDPIPITFEFETDVNYGCTVRLTTTAGVDTPFRLSGNGVATGTQASYWSFPILLGFPSTGSGTNFTMSGANPYVITSATLHKPKSLASLRLIRDDAMEADTSQTSDGPVNVFTDRMITITCDQIRGINTTLDSHAKVNWSDGPVAVFPIPARISIGEIMGFDMPINTPWINLTARSPVAQLDIRLRRDEYSSFGPAMIDWSMVLELR